MKTVPAILHFYFEILKVSSPRDVIETLHTTMRLEAIRAIQMISYNFYILEIEHISLSIMIGTSMKSRHFMGEKYTVFVYTNNKNNRILQFEIYCLTIYLKNNILRQHNKIFIDKKINIVIGKRCMPCEL